MAVVFFFFDTDVTLSTTSLERQRMNFKVGIAKSRELIDFGRDCHRGILFVIGRGLGRRLGAVLLGRRLGAVLLGRD